MASLSITVASPVAPSVVVSETANVVSVTVQPLVSQNTVVVSPVSMTNYFAGGGEVAADLTGVPVLAVDLGTFSNTLLSANLDIKEAFEETADGVQANTALINTNNANVTQLQSDLSAETLARAAADTTLTSSVSANASAIASNVASIQSNDGDITQLQSDISTEASTRANADTTLTNAVNANTAAINNLPGPSLAAALDPTETQLFFTDPGIFAQGTSIESVLRQLLIHFQPPVMTLSGWTSGTYEHGASYSDTDFTLSFSNFSNVDASDNGTAAFTDTYISNGTNAVVTPASSQTVSFSRSGTLLVTNTTPAGQSGSSVSRSNAAKLTLSSFTDSQGSGISNKAISSTVRYRYWILDSTTAINFGSLTNANGTSLVTTSSSLTGANAVESGLYSSVGNLSLSSNGSYDYVYWVYPTAVTVNNINNPLGLPIYTGDTTGSTSTAIIYIGTFTLTNQHGADVSMTVLRTKNSGALGSGTYTVS